jgi:hypothetical protein
MLVLHSCLGNVALIPGVHNSTAGVELESSCSVISIGGMITRMIL